MNLSFAAVDLIAEPAPPNPPLSIALAILSVSVAAPILFVKEGGPNPLLGVAILALAAAGLIAVFAAVGERRRARSDSAIRMRARIGCDGVTFYRAPAPAPGQFFPAHQIAYAQIFSHSLVIRTTDSYPAPGRYELRYGKSSTRRDQVAAALAALTRISC